MLFVAAVLAVNGLIGERGLLQTLRARRAYAAAAADVERLRQANEAAGGALQLAADIRLYATVGWVGP